MPKEDCAKEVKLSRTRTGRARALPSHDLLPLVYEELRVLARARLLKSTQGQSMQPTALVHEAYLRIVERNGPGWDSRGHFFAATARAMRDVLVEHARRKATKKRGGDLKRLSNEQIEPTVAPPSDDVLAVDEAMKRLRQVDPRKGHIVNLRFFARLTTAETASALGVSIGTIEREWRNTRAWLHRALVTDVRR